jgi:hypothetical protein
MPMMLELGGKYCTYYCTHSTINEYPKEIKKMAGNNIDIVVDNHMLALCHSCMLADVWHNWNSAENRVFFEIALEKMKMIYYTHGTDAVLPSYPGSYMLYSSDWQFYRGMGKSKYMLDEQGMPVWAVNAKGGEGALAGLIHLGDWAHVKETRAEFKRQAAQQFGMNLDPELPLLVYYTSLDHDCKEMDIGLAKLSEHANILIKDRDGLHSNVKGKNIFTFTDKIWGTWLPRFAADFILAGYRSGSLSTAVMLGFPVIPVYTQYIDTFYKGGSYKIHGAQCDTNTRRFKIFTDCIGGVFSAIMKHITPINISATDMILERINDVAYWKRYEDNISSIQHSIFGRYYTQDAPARAAAYVKNILQHGTMLAADIAALNKSFEGQPGIQNSCVALL